MLKYWIDLTGTVSDDVVLHCWFRSGDPTWYEKLYILEPAMNDIGKSVIEVNKITDLEGNDLTEGFKTLRVRTYEDHITLVVKREKKSLAGGEEDNILTGTYMFEPKSYLAPEKAGPYTPEELTAWARIEYFTENAYYPPEAVTEENSNGTVTIQLYENTEAGELPAHRSVYALYVLDADGNGFDAVTGKEVSLFR